MKRGLVQPRTLFSAVAVVLALTGVVTLSRVAVSTGDVGKLKCYDIKSGIEKAC